MSALDDKIEKTKQELRRLEAEKLRLENLPLYQKISERLHGKFCGSGDGFCSCAWHYEGTAGGDDHHRFETAARQWIKKYGEDDAQIVLTAFFEDLAICRGG